MPRPAGFLDDMVTLLEADGVGVFGLTIYTSSKSATPAPVLPNGSGTITIVETGGTSADRTHNAVIRPAIVRPGAQILCRAPNYDTAKALAHRAYDVYVQVRNQWVNSGKYLELVPRQEPFDGGVEPGAGGQTKCIFNVLGKVGQRPW